MQPSPRSSNPKPASTQISSPPTPLGRRQLRHALARIPEFPTPRAMRQVADSFVAPRVLLEKEVGFCSRSYCRFGIRLSSPPPAVTYNSPVIVQHKCMMHCPCASIVHLPPVGRCIGALRHLCGMECLGDVVAIDTSMPAEVYDSRGMPNVLHADPTNT